MLTELEIAALACDLQSACVERKASLSRKGDIEEAICAFANDLPGTGQVGVLLMGVDNKTGAPAGTPITDELLLTLTSIRSDRNILPFPNMHVYKAALQGHEIAVVEVTPSHEPPVRLRGVVRVRAGPRKGVATRDEERILTERRRGWDHPFDQRPVPGGLFGRATPQTLGRPGGDDYRNPTLAAGLYQLGFVQRFGLGVPHAEWLEEGLALVPAILASLPLKTSPGQLAALARPG